MSHNIEKWGCYRFGVKIGIKSLLNKNYLIGLKQLLFPVSYWRFPVFNLVLNKLNTDIDHKNIRVLDIGSPKLLSLYLALKYGYNVLATDLQDQEIFSRYFNHFLDYKPADKEKYKVEYQDARALKYPDEHFDVVYSLSVFEHIPQEGDCDAVREVARVLKSQGLAILEVPFASKAKDKFLQQNIYDRKYLGKPIFYQRHYDKDSVFSRLINQSGLLFEKAIVTKEKLPFEKCWYRIPKYFRIPFLWTEPIISEINHSFLTFIDINTLKNATFLDNNSMNITLFLRKI